MTVNRTPVVGRGRIRGIVRDLLDDGRSVLLAGASGIGKSRLAAAVAAEPAVARRVGARLLATEETGTMQLATLATGTRVPARASLPHTYAVLLESWGRAVPDGRTPLLLLDDAHHCDPATAAVLRIGVESGAVQLLACRRVPLPLPEHLEALVSSGAMETVHLDPLEGDSARRVVAARTTETLPPVVVDAIVALAEGNPLYLRELAASAARGRSPTALDTLEGVVGQAVLACEPAQRHLLELVAVAGPVPVELLAGRPDALAALRTAGLLVLDDGGVRLDHPLRRQWLLGELGELGPTLLGDFLDEVGDTAARALDPVRWVEWCRLAGRPADDSSVAEAVASALARADPQTASRLLGSLHGEDADGLRARVLLAEGRVQDGLAALEDRLAAGPPTPDLAWWCVRQLGMGGDDLPRAQRVVADMESTGTEESVLAGVRCRLWLANFCTAPTELPRAQWEAIARRIPDPVVRAETLSALGAAVLVSGHPPEAVGPVNESLRLLDGRTWTPVHGRVHTAAAIVALAVGETKRAQHLIEGSAEHARRRHDAESVLWLGGGGGIVLAALGQVRRSLSLSRQLAWTDTADGWFGFGRMRALTHLGTASYAPAEAGAEPESATPDAEGPVGPGAAPAVWARAHDLAAGARGDEHDDDAVLTVLELSRQRGHLTFVTLLAAECADLSSGTAVHRAVADLVPPTAGGLMTLVHASARARLAADAPALLELGRSAERTGWVTAALRLHADVLRLGTGADEDLRAGARAGLLRLVARWDAPDPWFVPGLPTARQREVAWSITQGRTTREVADQLGLSPRTVENHLQRVFEFTGVHDREVLARRLAPG